MPGFGDSALNPPQVNYYQLVTGDEAATAAAAAAAHQATAAMLSAEIATMTTSTTSTAAVGWQGAGGAAIGPIPMHMALGRHGRVGLLAGGGGRGW